MSLWAKLSAIWEALQAGKQLANPAVWNNRANSVAILTALITAAIGLARGFGIELPTITGVDIAQIALGLSTLGSIIVPLIFNASNKRAGFGATAYQKAIPPRPHTVVRRK
jgi:uncharacterized membrane protein